MWWLALLNCWKWTRGTSSSPFLLPSSLLCISLLFPTNFSLPSVPPAAATSDVVFDEDQMTGFFLFSSQWESTHLLQCVCFPNPGENASINVFIHNFDLQLRYGYYVITVLISCGTIIYTATQLIINSNYLSCRLKHLQSSFIISADWLNRKFDVLYSIAVYFFQNILAAMWPAKIAWHKCHTDE